MKIRILRRRGLGNGSTLGIKKFSKHDIEIIRNDRNIPEDTDLLVRWGCSSMFPSKKTLNKVDSMRLVNNKIISRKMMVKSDVNVPKLYETLEDIKYPCIVRPEFHSQGKLLFLCNNQDEFETAKFELNALGKNYYTSEYIEKDEEYGVFIFDNRVWTMIKKEPKYEGANNEIAWNVAQGSHKFINVKWSEWNIPVIKESLEAWKCFGLSFGRIDVIVKNGIPYILEINSAHSLTSNYRKESFAKCLDYYIENGAVKNDIEINEITSYKSIIYPALRENKLGKNL